MAKIFFKVTEQTIFENIVRMKSILSRLADILISINGEPDQPLHFPDKESSFGRIPKLVSPSVPHLVFFLSLPTLTRFFLESDIILIVLDT